jgi:hypothetical protein
MLNMQAAIERSYGRLHHLIAPLLTVTVGGTVLAGACTGDGENKSLEELPHPVTTTTAAAAQAAVDSVIIGRIETMYGEPQRVRSSPYGPEIGEYRNESQIRARCVEDGPPHGNQDSLTNRTWLQLAQLQTGEPFDPPRYIPVTSVVFERSAVPIPACPR